jgi:DNA-binding CsgD family transcriptional regulator
MTGNLISGHLFSYQSIHYWLPTHSDIRYILSYLESSVVSLSPMSTRNSLNDHSLIHGVADLILAVGQPNFIDKLTYLLRSAASFDDYVMLIYHPSSAPQVLSSSFANTDLAVWERYIQGAYLLSPFYDYCMQGKDGFVSLDEIAPDGFYDSAYYDNYFRPSRLIDEVCFVVQGRDNFSYLLSLGRTQTLAKFNQRVLDKLKALSPILQAAVQLDDQRRHAEHHPHPTSHAALKQRLLNYGQDKLTSREQDVMQLLIRGYSSKEAAQVLAISPETERVHRKNIYAKLEVESQKELLSQLFEEILSDIPA